LAVPSTDGKNAGTFSYFEGGGSVGVRTFSCSVIAATIPRDATPTPGLKKTSPRAETETIKSPLP
jgi:hypothetical protein